MNQISFIDISKDSPYDKFIHFYDLAINKNQEAINALAISSFNKINNEVESRFVNLKFIKKDEWIFFSNYKGPKSIEFKSHQQISALLYWNSIDVQVRIKAKIKKASGKFSDEYFKNRDINKNALSISSAQSKKIRTYEEIVTKYDEVLKEASLLRKRPNYWGGYSFTPYYFEFWQGNKFRINKREVFEFFENEWNFSIIQP